MIFDGGSGDGRGMAVFQGPDIADGKRSDFRVQNSTARKVVGNFHRRALVVLGLFLAGVLAGCLGGDDLSSRKGLIAGKDWSEISAAELDGLLAKGEADANRRIVRNFSDDKTPITPLMAAVIDVRPEHARALIKRGADVNAADYPVEIGPLHFAIGRGRVEMTEILLDAGADVNQRDVFGNPPLFYAARGRAKYGMKDDFFRVMDLLAAAGADVGARNSNGFGLVHDALIFGCLDSLRKLIEIGADVNAEWTLRTSRDGDKAITTPLMHAAYYFPDAVSLLADADIDASHAIYGHTALILAQLGAHPAESAELLINKGADVNKEDSSRLTALDYAKSRAANDGKFASYRSHAETWESVGKRRKDAYPFCMKEPVPLADVDDWKAAGAKAEKILRASGAVEGPGRKDEVVPVPGAEELFPGMLIGLLEGGE